MLTHEEFTEILTNSKDTGEVHKKLYSDFKYMLVRYHPGCNGERDSFTIHWKGSKEGCITALSRKVDPGFWQIWPVGPIETFKRKVDWIKE